MTHLKNKIALVTGASRGIGAAIAARLSAGGARVVLAARSTEQIERNASKLRGAGGDAIAVSCDVSEFEQVESAVAFCLERYGRLDILVNNAGTIDPISHLAESDAEAWRTAVNVNLMGVYHGMRCALPAMTRQGEGIVVNLSSGAATFALEGWSHYCATKAAVKMLTECGHLEYGKWGIRVVGLSPGTVQTDMMAKIRDSGVGPVSQLDWDGHIPPSWPAEAVAFLCSDEGAVFAGTDFSLKTEEGRRLVGLV